MMRIAVAGLLLLAGAARMPAAAAELDRPDAFEHGFAVSLYLFDACGDPLAGRMFRRALAEKFAQCPFSLSARTRYQQRTRAQQAKVRRTMEDLIESRGGLPVQLDGMSMTCRQQQTSTDYQLLRARLDAYTDGRLPVDGIIAAPCDAPDMAP